MSDFLDKYGEPDRAPADLLKTVRDQALKDFPAQKPARSWRTDAFIMFAASLGVFVITAIVLMVTGNAQPELLRAKSMTLLPLAAASALCAFAALAPRRRMVRIAAAGAGLTSAVILVIGRIGMVGTSSAPQWFCTAYHVAVAIIPIVVALSLLRSAAPSPLRAAVAGLAMGTTGAMLGEIACDGGVDHVALFHIGAWAIVVALCLLISLVMRPRSYAP